MQSTFSLGNLPSNSLWTSFLADEHIRYSQIFLSIIREVPKARTKLPVLGYAISRRSISCGKEKLEAQTVMMRSKFKRTQLSPRVKKLLGLLKMFY
jgi:hypothetical protein